MNFVKDIGVNLYVGGFVLVGKNGPVLVTFPNTDLYDFKPTNPGQSYDHYMPVFKPTPEEFEKIVHQMDVQEVEITQSNGEKMVVRMTQRSLDSGITWRVYDRDEYKCRYCGAKGIPMTIEHVQRWEEGGDTTMENCICACRKCNKQRGDSDYAEWLNSDTYKKKSVNVEEKFRRMNEALVSEYQGFRKRISVRKR